MYEIISSLKHISCLSNKKLWMILHEINSTVWILYLLDYNQVTKFLSCSHSKHFQMTIQSESNDGNIVGKREMVVTKFFSLLHLVPKGLLLAGLVQFKFLWYKLTHYQTTNFRLFETLRVCRRQFQIQQKWQKVIQTGRKHCGKGRNCSLQAISPFPTVFSTGLFPRHVKGCYCVGMG